MKDRVRARACGELGSGVTGWARGARLLDHVERPVGEAGLARVGVGARGDVAVREENHEDAAAVRLIEIGARAPWLGLGLGLGLAYLS